MSTKDPKKVSAGRKGGILKWAQITKKKRSNMMKKVAQARYKKNVSINYNREQ